MSLIKTYTLNDFFNDTFKQLGGTLKNCYKPLLLILFPLSFLYGMGLVHFMGQIFESFYLLDTADSLGDFMPLIGAYTKLLGLALLVSLGALIARIVVINYMGSKFFPQQTWDVAEKIKSSTGNLILASLLQFLIILGVAVAFGIVIGLSVFLATTVSPGLGIFLSVILYIGLYVVLIWLIFSFSLFPFAIVMDEAGPWESLKKSFMLVRKNWWRFFGISLLFSMMISFALSLVTSPLLMFSIIPSFADLFGAMDSSLDEYQLMMNFLQVFQSRSFAIVLSLVTLIQYFGSTIVWNVYQSFFFVDLKVRKEELQAESEDIINA